MDSRFLESFVMVVENGSFAETARRLHLTPAAVAQRIRALETEIGARLVSRSGRSVRPTPAGTAILDRAKNFLGGVRDLKSIATSDRPSGELRLGATPTSTSGLLPDILVLLAKRYPQIDVYMQHSVSVELYHQVLDGHLDAAIIAQPPFAIPKGYDWRLLRVEPLIVLAPASARARDPNAVLMSHPLIRQRRNTWLGRLVDGYLRHAGIRPRERFELDALEAIAVMVDRGLGVALVHDWAPPWPEGLALAKISLATKQFDRRMGLIWNRASVRVRLVHAFLDVAVEALAAGGAVDAKRKGAHPRRSRRRSK
ncbi:MAG TPA: LysR family transcriptional regulator [Xanthobacteraceae bacterium]|nr:LysR family transcriptional regulator [Xanthobacteraceae bacterium]